jgi:TDG/mug DNA glycosylase family protein
VQKATVKVYEAEAERWRNEHPPKFREKATAFAARCAPGAVRLDVGSGPGTYVADLGRPLIALDAAYNMVDLNREIAPDVAAVQADLEALPFKRGSLGGAWARASYLHVPKTDLPMALARLHHCLSVGAPVYVSMRRGDAEGEIADDEFAGRFFAEWPSSDLVPVVEGAGFVIDEMEEGGEWIQITATRDRTLPDFVAAGMKALVCGLNPSVIAADAGFGYATGSNRFWRAAVTAGLMSVPRDPWTALARDHVGMTDMVKRATPKSSMLSKDEYRAGAARVERLVHWLEPKMVVFVGLEGWRAAVDAKATAGLQHEMFGGSPAYVMPSTSGLNANIQMDGLVAHFQTIVTQVGSL